MTERDASPIRKTKLSDFYESNTNKQVWVIVSYNYGEMTTPAFVCFNTHKEAEKFANEKLIGDRYEGKHSKEKIAYECFYLVENVDEFLKTHE